MLRSVVLHGELAACFGPSFELEIASPAEAIRALIVQLKGFRKALSDGHFRIVRGSLNRGTDLDVNGCKLALGRAEEMHIVPVVAGSARSGLGKVLAGVALIGLAVFAPYALGGGMLFGGAGAVTIFGVSTQTIGAIGASLALSGVAQMLAPTPKLQGGSANVDQNASFLFGGQTNTTTQGGPVPLVYGRFQTGTVVISAGLDSEQVPGVGGASSPQVVLSDVLLHNIFKGR